MSEGVPILLPLAIPMTYNIFSKTSSGVSNRLLP
jgi:hypothetical protein